MLHLTLTQRKIAPALCLLTLLSGVLACNLLGQAQPTALPAEALAATAAALAMTAQAGVPTSMVSPPLPATFPPTIVVPTETPLVAAPPTLTPTPTHTPTLTPTPTHTPTLTPTPPTTFITTTTSTPTELPPPPGGGFSGIAKSDLEITNIGPVSTTREEKVFVDLKNNGPSAFSGKIRVVCVGYGYMRNDPAQMVPTGSDELIDITIGVGTSFFYPSMIINVPLYSYQPIQCIIEVPDNKDPNPNNNSYTIVIP